MRARHALSNAINPIIIGLIALETLINKKIINGCEVESGLEEF